MMDVDYVDFNNNASFSLVTSLYDHEVDVYIWHAKLNHISQDRMSRLVKQGLLGNLEKVKLSICEHCLKGKLTRKPFGKATRAEFPLQLIHSDVCSLMNVRLGMGPITSSLS